MGDINGQFQAHDEIVGIHGNGPMNDTTEGLMALLASHSLCAINTKWPAGDTYYGTETSKVIDFIFIPQTWVHEVTWCRTLRRSAWRLQAHSQSKLWDHVPIGLAIPLDIIAEPYQIADSPRFSGEA
eukprot:2319254-Pyramimonas_sp.AAC.1